MGNTDLDAWTVRGLCQLVFDFRLVAVLLTIVAPRAGRPRPVWALVLLAVAVLTSYVPLRRWKQLGPVVMRHPLFLMADALIGTLVLALAGASGPFFYFTLGTAVLAGVLYEWRGAALFSVILVAGYWWALALPGPIVLTRDSFQAVLGLPLLYPLLCLVGWSVRLQLDRHAATVAQLAATAQVAAAAEERARLAREMHDSVAKTLHGIALAAQALPRWIDRSPEEAARRAGALANGAELAAQEARNLVADLRADTLDEPLAEAIRGAAEQWTRSTGVPVALDISGAEAISPGVRYELLSILREALRNVDRHAGAATVSVTLSEEGGMVVLSVRDDGGGFTCSADRGSLQLDGHYGLVGMDERAKRAGGSFQVVSAPGQGTTVTVTAAAALPDDLSTIGGRARGRPAPRPAATS